ncbi:MAG: nucleoside kinase [Clostridiaceae bacterium]
MKTLSLNLCNGKKIKVKEGTMIQEIIEKYYTEEELPVMLAKVNGKCYELNTPLKEGGVLQAVKNNTNTGRLVYGRTVTFIFISAALDLFPGSKITMEHSISKGIYGEIHKEKVLTKDEVVKIKKKMQELIDRNLPINKVKVPKEEAVSIFEDYGMVDKVRLLFHMDLDKVKLYELEGRYDYFYGQMAPNTGYVKIFDLISYEDGFILRYPDEAHPKELLPFKDQKKLSNIFRETEQWLNILGVGEVGTLNDKMLSRDAQDLIRVSEALHEKKLVYIADKISELKEVRIILVAGPSSSGKTTFAKRLSIQLRVNGLIPMPISLDDYFINRDKNPLDENGKPNYENITSLDLELFNKHIEALLQGKEVETPIYDFITGRRSQYTRKLHLPQNGVLIIEGIHGLNKKLTTSIKDKNKFKIYISALTQLNLDNHNRISTTDVRIIRRLVRDYLTRGNNGEDTLMMWPAVKNGEEKNIFVFQEEADVMFNSTLVYELCVLKSFAINELNKIKEDSPVFLEAERLKAFLGFFKEVSTDVVPENSILREFIGGSCFYKY